MTGKQRRTSAFSAALREAQQQAHSDVVEPSEQITSDVEKPLHRETVTPEHSKAALQKTSFYLTAEQSGKLDDLAYSHSKRTGKRINRNDIVRYLIDLADSASLSGL